MSELHITFDLPDFQHRFVWEANDSEFAALDRHMHDFAAKAGLRRAALTQNAIRKARELLNNPDPV